MIRAFIALDLPESALAALERIQRRLIARLATGAIRWSPVKSMHLTVKFLGDVDEARVPELIQAFTVSVAATLAFKLQLGELGCFPSFEKPSVIWVGVRGEVSALNGLHKHIESAVRPVLQELEVQEFRPHLTLGRIKPNARQSARRLGGLLKAETIDVSAGCVNSEWEVNCITFYQSTLTPKGPIHTPLQRFDFKRAPRVN